MSITEGAEAVQVSGQQIAELNRGNVVFCSQQEHKTSSTGLDHMGLMAEQSGWLPVHRSHRYQEQQ